MTSNPLLKCLWAKHFAVTPVRRTTRVRSQLSGRGVAASPTKVVTKLRVLHVHLALLAWPLMPSRTARITNVTTAAVKEVLHVIIPWSVRVYMVCMDTCTWYVTSQRGLRSKPIILRIPPGKAFFTRTWTSILLRENWVSGISLNIWKDIVSKWTHRLQKNSDDRERSLYCRGWGCYPQLSREGAIWSRKCHSWKDCPGDLTLMNTDTVNFCTRSRPY